MSLFPCPFCSKRIPSTANFCPYCAYQIRDVQRSGKPGVRPFNRAQTLVLAIPFIFLVLTSLCLGNPLNIFGSSSNPVPFSIGQATPTLTPADTTVLIPAGSFQMGSETGNSNEKPVHAVVLSAFRIDTHEVTNSEYARCVKAGKCQPPSDLSANTLKDYYSNGQYRNYPVVHVTWNQADTYCRWRGARLPNEAEWEKAARGGLDGKKYPWGDMAPICQSASPYGARYASCGVNEPAALAVGIFGANGYGLVDMGGNVSEWVADWYDENYYSGSPATNPPGPGGGSTKVIRGGDWSSSSAGLRAAARYASPPGGQDAKTGFRCAATLGD